MIDRSELYSTKEVADLIGIPIKTIQAWAKQMKIPGRIKVGRRWMFKKAEIKEALSQETFLLSAEYETLPGSLPT